MTPITEFLSPIVVSSNVYPVGVNSTLQVNPTQLLNPNRTAMLIDQIRFSPGLINAVDASAFLYQQSVSIQLGSIYLTNGSVPIAALCPSYDYSWDNASIGRTALGPQTAPQYVWHFPRPLYVPPNVLTYVNTKRTVLTNDSNTGNTDFRVSIVGRSLPRSYPVPANIFVPWATSATVNTTQITTNSGVQTYVTPDNALGNPNSSSLMVTRLTGFHASLSALGVSAYDRQTGPNGITLRMTISSGKLLIREPTPFFHLFPSSRRYLDLRAILRGSNEVKGGEFVKARLDYTIASGGNVGGASDGFPITIVGLQGYRSVPTPLGANNPP